jgi:hypothetical protein
MPKSANAVPKSPADLLQLLSKQALEIAKKARKHRKSLAGDNHYGNKLASLRSDATNAYTDLVGQSVGDSAALAELIDAIFSPETSAKDRAGAVRQLEHSLKTTWRSSASPAQLPQEFFFPPSILADTKRAYIVRIGNQMNGCFDAGHMDACAVMVRRLVEIGIIEVYEAKGIAANIKDGNGDYLMLSRLVTAILNEPAINLTRSAKTHLPRLRTFGHLSAHGRYYTARRPDLEALRDPCRVVLEELFAQAGLI